MIAEHEWFTAADHIPYKTGPSILSQLRLAD